MSLAWMTADFQNNCSMLSSQLENGTKVGRRSGTKMCWNLPSRPTTSQLTSGKPWPRTGRPGGQLFARAQTTLRKAVYRAWMKRDQQGRTECQTLALLYLACSAARSALPLSGSKPICANTNTDASSSKSKDYYYYYTNIVSHEVFIYPVQIFIQGLSRWVEFAHVTNVLTVLTVTSQGLKLTLVALYTEYSHFNT